MTFISAFEVCQRHGRQRGLDVALLQHHKHTLTVGVFLGKAVRRFRQRLC